MKVAHFDCFSGISGDMTLAALFDAGVPTEPVIDGIASLGLPIQIRVSKVRNGGFAATRVQIEAPDEEEDRYLADVEAIIDKGMLSDRQRALAKKIFRRLAEAEAKVHGMPLDRVHFHEVGALDSIADIVGAAIGLDLLGVGEFTSASTPTGWGTVKCAHGIMPVPTPATLELLRGVPLRPSRVEAELTTPTGAAILTSVVTRWVESPAMTVETIGIGAGTKEFLEQPNILRLLVGTAEPESSAPPNRETDVVWELQTNLDDIPGEVIGYTIERLYAAGAVEVFTTAVAMKKNRPGVLLTVLTDDPAIEKFEDILFQETRTFGIRTLIRSRRKRQRRAIEVSTPWGPVAGKLGWFAGQSPIFTPEFESCATIAREIGAPIAEVMEAARQAFATDPTRTTDVQTPVIDSEQDGT